MSDTPSRYELFTAPQGSARTPPAWARVWNAPYDAPVTPLATATVTVPASAPHLHHPSVTEPDDSWIRTCDVATATRRSSAWPPVAAFSFCPPSLAPHVLLCFSFLRPVDALEELCRGRRYALEADRDGLLDTEAVGAGQYMGVRQSSGFTWKAFMKHQDTGAAYTLGTFNTSVEAAAAFDEVRLRGRAC